jgi:hypothetical protein
MAIVTQQTGQFSGYTLTELRALVLRMLRVKNTTNYSPTEGTADYDWIDDGLNRGQEDFVRKTKCLKSYAIVELKANYRTYRLPWDFLDLKAAYFYDSSLDGGYQELTITTAGKLTDDVGDWRTATGTPSSIYIDRIYGNTSMFGLYPIPDEDGGDIEFDSEYGAVVDWVCPTFTFSSEYGIIINMDDVDQYVMNTDTGVVADASTMNKNVLMEYYRFPQNLIVATEGLGFSGAPYPEVPREYQKSLAYFAVSDLLQNNPEDSAEFKRAGSFEKRFKGEIKDYINLRKRPLAGQDLQRRAAVWNWTQNMPFRKGF